VEIEKVLHSFICETYLQTEDNFRLNSDTPLLTTGIIDSIGVLGLINFIETRFGIEFMARELDRDQLETIDRICTAVRSKMKDKESQ
jgi:acyl carrier protein